MGNADDAQALERAKRQLGPAMRERIGQLPRPWSDAEPTFVEDITDRDPEDSLQRRAYPGIGGK